MIRTVVARHNDEIYTRYLEPSLKKIVTKVFGVAGDENIYVKYNLGIEEHIKDGLQDDDIVMFAHEDVLFLDSAIQAKMDYIFSKPDIGVVGVVGCREFSDNGAWWQNPTDKLFGHIVQENGEEEFHLVKNKVGFVDDAVVVDGLLMAVRGKILKDGARFNQSWGVWHHYDVSFCLDVLMNTSYKVAIADILVKHRSPGMGSLTEDWKKSKKIVVDYYEEKGLHFPITKQKIDMWKKR